MSEHDVLPELKQIIGAMLFASKTPVTVGDIRRCLEQVAEAHGGPARDFASVTPEDIRTALEALDQALGAQKVGFHVIELANGFRLENDVNCGLWLRHLLQKGRPNRLSKPALETLAIIAYRQPCTRAEIEAVRGVAVDQILRNLMDMQLIRITGRSELPGRPWMFGTAQKFLEYFGLRDVEDLPGVDELRRMEEEQERKRKEETPAPEPTLQEAPAQPAVAEADPGVKPDEPDEAGDEEEPDPDDDEYDEDEFDDDDEDDEDDDEEEEDLEDESGEEAEDDGKGKD